MNYTERFQVVESPYSPTPVSTHTLTDIFRDESIELLLENDRYNVSNDVWERCLLDPVKTFLKKPGKSLRRDFVELGWKVAWLLSQQVTPQSHTSRRRYDKNLNIHPPQCPEELISLVEFLHSGSLVIDDIEDQSITRRGQPCLHLQVGLAPALNVGNWLYFVSGHMIDRLECDALTRVRLYAQLNRVMLRCHQGQAIDVSYKVTQLERGEIFNLTELSTRLKTGVLVGFATQLGALYFNLSEKMCETLYHFGEQIGLGLQMYDDLSGFMNESRWNKGCEDISRQRLTWVWSWLSRHSEVSDQDFSIIMSSLTQLSVRGDKAVNELISTEWWRADAEELRDQCLPYLISAESEIRSTIKGALDTLRHKLGNGEAHRIAVQAVIRLQNSYL